MIETKEEILSLVSRGNSLGLRLKKDTIENPALKFEHWKISVVESGTCLKGEDDFLAYTYRKLISFSKYADVVDIGLEKTEMLELKSGDKVKRVEQEEITEQADGTKRPSKKVTFYLCNQDQSV